MFSTRSTTLRIVKITGIVIVAGLIITYAISRSLNYARGPYIGISEPANYSAISSSTVTIRGRVLRANNLSLNGQDLSIDEQGNFSETVIIFPGMNILTVAAKDQFGRSTQKQLQLVGALATMPSPLPITSP